MSSISSFNTQPYMAINMLQDGNFEVQNQNDAGGDTVDGDTVVGAHGKVVSGEELNKLLAANNVVGLQAVNGRLVSTDGVDITSTNSDTVTNFGGPPPLPDVPGAAANPAAVAGNVGTLQNASSQGDGALMWMAMSTMARLSMREMKDASEIKIALQNSKLQAKQNEINAKAAQIKDEQSAALVNLCVSVGAAVGGYAMGAAGSATDNAGLMGAAQASTQAVNAAGNYVNKAVGPQAQADQKQLEQMRWQKDEDRYDQDIEAAKQNYDQAREQFKAAMKAITDHCDRQTQIIQKATS